MLIKIFNRIFVFSFILIFSVQTVSASTIRFAQISDVHYASSEIPEKYSTYYYTPYLLQAAINKINNDNMTKFTIITGDISENKFSDSQKALFGLNKLNNPWYYVLGNHDIREKQKNDYIKLLNEIYPNFYNKNKLFYSFKPQKDITFIGIDTVLKARGRMGIVSKEQIDYIEKILKHSSKKDIIVIFSHHPLVKVNGKSFISNQKDLDILFSKYNIPILLLSGHLHNPQIFTKNNIIVSVAPALFVSGTYRIITISNSDDCAIINFDYIETDINNKLPILKILNLIYGINIKESNKNQTIILKKKQISHRKKIFYYLHSKYLLLKYKINITWSAM